MPPSVYVVSMMSTPIYGAIELRAATNGSKLVPRRTILCGVASKLRPHDFAEQANLDCTADGRSLSRILVERAASDSSTIAGRELIIFPEFAEEHLAF